MNPTTPATNAPRRSRRLLVPLATLAAAGALFVGSGADFSSTSQNSQNVVTSGTFDQLNSRNGEAIFSVANIKPGDSVTGSVEITNTGSLPAVFTVTEDASNGFTDPAKLQMTITEDGASLYKGTFGGFDGRQLGRFESEETRLYVYTVTLLDTAGNEERGKSADATYTWDAAQTDDVAYDQSVEAPVAAKDLNPGL
jgi:spore coat-associated protein N